MKLKASYLNNKIYFNLNIYFKSNKDMIMAVGMVKTKNKN